MSIVDTWHLQFEVEAEYPHGTAICADEAAVRRALDFQKDVHGVACRVRAVGEWTRFYGAPS